MTSDVRALRSDELNALVFSCTPERVELVCEPHDLAETQFKRKKFIGARIKESLTFYNYARRIFLRSILVMFNIALIQSLEASPPHFRRSFNPLVPTAPLVARSLLWTWIARVIEGVETNGKSPKVGRRNLHHLLAIQRLQFWANSRYKSKIKGVFFVVFRFYACDRLRSHGQLFTIDFLSKFDNRHFRPKVWWISMSR